MEVVLNTGKMIVVLSTQVLSKKVKVNMLNILVCLCMFLYIYVCFESKVATNSGRKQRKCAEFIKCLELNHDEVRFVNLFLGPIGIYDKSCD